MLRLWKPSVKIAPSLIITRRISNVSTDRILKKISSDKVPKKLKKKIESALKIRNRQQTSSSAPHDIKHNDQLNEAVKPSVALKRDALASKQKALGHQHKSSEQFSISNGVDKLYQDNATQTIKFKDAPVLKSILAYIEQHKLCMTRIQRRTKAQKKDNLFHLVEDKNDNSVLEFTRQRRLRFMAVADAPSEFPPETVPEICVIGRSNVGKSSLVNSITNSLKAATSEKPGETQSVHWYTLPGLLHLVDLPGYGFSFSSEQKKNAWRETLNYYLEHRKSLKRVFILIDARVGFKQSDFEIMDYLDSIKRKYQIVLTKTDLLYANDLAKRHYIVRHVLKRRKKALDDVIMISSKTHAGMYNLRKNIASVFAATNKQESKKS